MVENARLFDGESPEMDTDLHRGLAKLVGYLRGDFSKTLDLQKLLFWRLLEQGGLEGNDFWHFGTLQMLGKYISWHL